MQNGCENRPHGTGILPPGSIVRIPFAHTITAGATERKSIAPPGQQVWRFLDAVIEDTDEDIAVVAPATVQFNDLLDGSGNQYLPKVGDRTTDQAEVSPQAKVRVGNQMSLSRVNTFPGGRSQGPICTFDKPLSSSDSPCQIEWTEYDGTADQDIRGYYEFRVVK